MVYLIEPLLKIDFKQRFVSYSGPRQEYEQFPKSCVSITIGAICKNYFCASDRHTSVSHDGQVLTLLLNHVSGSGPPALGSTPRTRTSSHKLRSFPTHAGSRPTSAGRGSRCSTVCPHRRCLHRFLGRRPPPIHLQSLPTNHKPWCSAFHVLHSYYPLGSLKAIMKVPFRFWKLMRTFVD